MNEIGFKSARKLGLATTLAAALVGLVSLAFASEPARPVGPEPAAAEAAVEQTAVEEPGPPAARAARHLGEGSASYYSDLLEGRPTASGQPYRGADLTAAHRSLPFGSRLRVTNLANGRSVVVRVNDRGPFSRRHVLDVSRTAAGRLGILTQGHARVRMELVH